MTKIDRHILVRLTVLTIMVIAVLIFVFIVIDFSENSDNFTDRGATLSDIWNRYYLNYIPEIIRLVSPLAVFVATLLIVGQMSERVELTAIKCAGVSLYRFLIPFLVFATLTAALVSYLDGYVIPSANAERIDFEREYVSRGSQRVDRNRIYRQESPETLMIINFYDNNRNIAYGMRYYHFDGDEIVESMNATRMEWQDSTQTWRIIRAERRVYHEFGFDESVIANQDTTFNIYPRDLARTTADIYLLTYPEIVNYLNSLQRSGAAGMDEPMVQFYGKAAYPFGIIIITIIGFVIASERRKGGKGAIFGMGLAISFLYIAFMKIVEPFGSAGSIQPLHAALLPHAVFLVISVVMLLRVKK